MQGPGRPDIVNAGSGETRYSECRVRGLGIHKAPSSAQNWYCYAV
ncbi:unnamed protein product, partial [Staurois parvus]